MFLILPVTCICSKQFYFAFLVKPSRAASNPYPSFQDIQKVLINPLQSFSSYTWLVERYTGTYEREREDEDQSAWLPQDFCTFNCLIKKITWADLHCYATCTCCRAVFWATIQGAGAPFSFLAANLWERERTLHRIISALEEQSLKHRQWADQDKGHLAPITESIHTLQEFHRGFFS